MGNLLNPAISIGPLVLGLGILTAVVCIALYLRAGSPRVGASLPRFLVLAVVVGFVAFVAGTAIGIWAFCSTPDSGNLCGLGGIFGVGPFLAGIAIGGYAWLWLRGTRGAA